MCYDNNYATNPCAPNADVVSQATAASVGLQEVTIPFNEASFFPNMTDTSACVTETTIVYVQYSCINSADGMATNYNQIAVAEAIAILIAILFFIQLRRLYQGSKIMQLEWDMATITAGDYTVEMMIDAKAYEAWDNQRGESFPGVPEGYAFKKYLHDELVNKFNEELKEMKESLEKPKLVKKKDKKKKDKKNKDKKKTDN